MKAFDGLDPIHSPTALVVAPLTLHEAKDKLPQARSDVASPMQCFTDGPLFAHGGAGFHYDFNENDVFDYDDDEGPMLEMSVTIDDEEADLGTPSPRPLAAPPILTRPPSAESPRLTAMRWLNSVEGCGATAATSPDKPTTPTCRNTNGAVKQSGWRLQLPAPAAKDSGRKRKWRLLLSVPRIVKKQRCP